MFGHLHVLTRCLQETVRGPYFPDWKFHTLIGLTSAEVEHIGSTGPEAPSTMFKNDGAHHATPVAADNVANNLVDYPHGVSRADLEVALGCVLAEVANATATWRGGQPFFEIEARGYFDCADNA